MTPPADENPYASPADFAAGRIETAGDAVLDKSRLLYRRIRLPPPYTSVVEYSGRGFGYDAVRVDGRTVAWNWKWFWFVPRFAFRVPRGGESVPAVLRVRVAATLAIKRLTLEVDDQLLYEEGWG